jgi:hypothetical protein
MLNPLAEGRSRASRRGRPGVSGRLGLGGPPAARRAIGQAQMSAPPWQAVVLANAVANNESGRARTRLELPRSPRGVPAGYMDKDGRIWTNLILLRIRRLGVRVPSSAPPYPQVKALLPAIGKALALRLGACRLTISHSPKRSCESWRARPGPVAGPPRSRGRRSSA